MSLSYIIHSLFIKDLEMNVINLVPLIELGKSHRASLSLESAHLEFFVQ